MRQFWLCAFLAGSALAQSPAPPAFEVASVKINPSYRQDDPSTWRPAITVNPGTLTIRNATLRMITAFAYDIQRPMVVGPEWLNTERYDIAAKAPGEATPSELQAMLRGLLADRFKMES